MAFLRYFRFGISVFGLLQEEIYFCNADNLRESPQLIEYQRKLSLVGLKRVNTLETNQKHWSTTFQLPVISTIQECL